MHYTETTDPMVYDHDMYFTPTESLALFSVSFIAAALMVVICDKAMKWTSTR